LEQGHPAAIPDLRDDIRTAEDGAGIVDSALLDLDRHAVGRLSVTGADSVRCTGTPAPGSGAARSAATGWSARTPPSSTARRFTSQ
jgi:hypothetical protein